MELGREGEEFCRSVGSWHVKEGEFQGPEGWRSLVRASALHAADVGRATVRSLAFHWGPQARGDF